jgi:hypothetical protein
MAAHALELRLVSQIPIKVVPPPERARASEHGVDPSRRKALPTPQDVKQSTAVMKHRERMDVNGHHDKGVEFVCFPVPLREGFCDDLSKVRMGEPTRSGAGVERGFDASAIVGLAFAGALNGDFRRQ